MESFHILWADDEIELLRGHILFLEQKGYQVSIANSGADALELFRDKHFDIVFLDENMPGLSGLETLNKMKAINSFIPMVMITKSEEEYIMEDAIGSKIAEYLIKPVHPTQILSTLKKHLDNKRLISEKTNLNYQQEFGKIGMALNNRMDYKEWAELYKQLVFWELELEGSTDASMLEVFQMQKREANRQFSRFIDDNYQDWVINPKNAPLISPNIFKDRFLPFVESQKECVFLIVIDNLRFDQWKIIQPALNNWFRLEEEEMYYAILPTATQYARNAMFAGLMPDEIKKLYPKLWKDDEEEGGKNEHEEELMQLQLGRLRKNLKTSYTKITSHYNAKQLEERVLGFLNNDINVIVYNFVDMLSHARTEMEVLKELAEDEKGYRSITKSWFDNSPLFDVLKKLAERKIKVVITTDHGTIRVNNPVQIVGDRNTNSNLRYKNGKSLNYNAKEVFEIKKPEQVKLPKQHVSSSYVFAKENDFFAYPNNYNYFVNMYRNTFQHGGVSLEEMLIPYITLVPK
jgi:DNA-binding response OmpR family regulator